MTIVPIFSHLVDPKAIALTEHHDEIAQTMDAPRHELEFRSQKPLPKILTRGETRGIMTNLYGDFIYRLLDHVPQAFLEELREVRYERYEEVTR